VAYLYNTPEQQRQMLTTIGVGSIAELFDQVPAPLRLDRPLDLPRALTEIELESHLRELAARNGTKCGAISFVGGGSYDHFIPAAVDAIASRSEFYTAYTPARVACRPSSNIRR
jgi:glycine dehydrogenase subunit 1